MFKIKTIIKYYLCCKYHKGLPELCEELTSENKHLKAENKKLLPTTEHVFSGCSFTGGSGKMITAELCTKCGEYKPYINNFKITCQANYRRLFRELSRDWSKTLIPLDLFDDFCNEKAQQEKQKKDNEEIAMLRKCLREPVCLIK